MPELFHGTFVNLEKTDGGDLQILLNRNGQRVFDEIERIRGRPGIDATMRILLADFFKRQWCEVRPEEIGALTSALIISDEAHRDPDGTLLSVGHVYWNERYQVEDEIEELRKSGEIRFRGVW